MVNDQFNLSASRRSANECHRKNGIFGRDRLRFVTILLRIVAQSRAVQNAAQIYLAPRRHPVISAIAPELASSFAHILTEPLPENLAALLRQLDAKLSSRAAVRQMVMSDA